MKTYNEVIQTMTNDDLKVLFENLREHQDMQQAIITSYLYAPLLGMTSQSLPNGKIITYHYDNDFRLETIRDNDGDIIKHYEYNFAEE